MRCFSIPLVLLALCLCSLSAQAASERRVALVIGNGAYKHVATLANPANDARAMADALRKLGFELVEGRALTNVEGKAGMEFVWVPGGTFEMGCGSWAGECLDDEKPVHTVRLDGFWLGKFEVTQGQWQKVMGNNPSSFKKGDNFPVESVSWDDCKEFLSRLNAQGSARFRLPTEAEWEYAARSGGKAEKYAGGDDIDRVAWYDDNSGGSTHAVGTKAPNGLGLYDMSGNVWEWCEDFYDSNYYSRAPQNNPINTTVSVVRVLRGGSWLHNPGIVRSARRTGDLPDDRSNLIGFRVVRLGAAQY